MTTLLIMPSDRQEAIFATAAIEAFFQGQGGTLKLLASPRIAELFLQDDRLSGVIVFEPKHPFWHWRETGRFAKGLGFFDRVVNLDASAASAWLAARIKTQSRTGYETRFNPPFVWKNRLIARPGLHRAAHYTAAIGAALGKGFEPTPHPRLIAKSGGTKAGVALAPADRKNFVGDWGAYRWAETALKLSAQRSLVLLDSGGAIHATDRMEEVLRYNGENRFINLAAEGSLSVLIAKIAGLELVIGAEGFVTQAAMALGVPTVMMMGSKDPAVYGPLPGGKAKLLYKKADCAPCAFAVCPHRQPLCLGAIRPAEVVAAAETLLKG